MTKIITDISKNIQWVIRKGVFNSFTITFTQSAVPFDISPYDFSINFQKFESDIDIVSLTESVEITNGGASGILTVILDETNSDLLNDDIYYWELKYIFSTKNYTLLQGSAIVNKQISTEDTETSLSIAVNLTGSNLQAEVNIVASSVGGGSGTVESVNSGNGITIDNTDPVNPIVNLGGNSSDNILIENPGNANVFGIGGTDAFAQIGLFSTTSTQLYSGVYGFDITNAGILLDLPSSATGDIFTRGASTFLTRIPDIATGNVLISGGVGVVPSYGKAGLTTHVSGILPISNGGTGSSVVNFWPLTGSASLTGNVVINGGGTRNINLGQSGNNLAFFGVQATTDYHLFVGDVTDFLGQYSIVSASTKEMETTVQLAGVYDIGIRMGGDTGNGGHLNITSGSGSSTTTTFTISGWDAFRINLGSDDVGDFHYTGTSLNQTRLPDVAVGNVLLSGGVGAAPSYGKVDLTLHITGDLPFANLTQGAALSVLGVTGNAIADVASIVGATDQILRINNAGNALAFGSIDLSKSATVGTSILPVANGGLNFSSYTIGDLIQASAAGVLTKLNSVATGNVLISGGVATVSSWGKVTSSHIDATIQTAGLSWLLASGGALTANNTISGAFTATFTNTNTKFNSGVLQVRNPANTFDYTFVGSALAATRNVTLPLLAGDDVFVFNDFAATLTNKTLGTGTVFSVIPTINDGITFTFNPSGTVSGVNIGAHTADPSGLVNGDLWLNSTTNQYKGRVSATTVVFVGMTTAAAANAIPFISSNGLFHNLSANLTFVTNRLIGTTLYLTTSAGTVTAGTAPILMTSSGTGVTGLLTTAEKGAVEFTDRGLWFSPAASTRHKVLHGLVGAAAPATNAIGVIVDYFGTSATRTLNTPNTWISAVGDDGNTYKIPGYS